MATMDVLDATGTPVTIEKPLAPGAAAASASRPVALSTEDVARVGATNETAAASDTATAGLNGRLQRIAQRLTSLIAVFGIGAGTEAAAVRVTLPTDGTGKVGLNAGTALVGRVKPEGDEYETVAASQTAQTLGATGATGDYIAGILVVPANLNPGNVLLLDNATSITVFAGGTNSVSNLIPFFIPLGMTSVSGAWKITTGASVSCIGIGNFT
jgi:hypothetical protein